MGERQVFQPLTKEEKRSVVLYRTGIAFSAIIVSCLAGLLKTAPLSRAATSAAEILGYALYATIGVSVFFIHLYIGQFKKFLKNLYYVSLACLALLLFLGKGSPSGSFLQQPFTLLLLLPLSGCLGFVTAKEAFCFQLFEGYFLAMLMPVYLLAVSSGVLGMGGTANGLVLIAVMLVIFTLRKVFMPLAYDIGDKSAYR